MESNHYTEDIGHIRSVMERSSRFISLSGWAGILIAPVLLSFYGLALLLASPFTLKSVFWLGVIEIALSFPAGVEGWGIPVLTIGFGFAHIIYGMLQITKYTQRTNT